MSSEARGWLGFVAIAFAGVVAALALSIVLVKTVVLAETVVLEGASFYEVTRLHGVAVFVLGPGEVHARFTPSEGVLEASLLLGCLDDEGAIQDYVVGEAGGGGELSISCSGRAVLVAYNMTVEPFTLELGELRVWREWP